jgi:hypothetical protein
MTTEERFAGILSKLNDNEFNMLEKYFKNDERERIKAFVKHFQEFNMHWSDTYDWIITAEDWEEFKQEIEKTEGIK